VLCAYLALCSLALEVWVNWTIKTKSTLPLVCLWPCAAPLLLRRLMPTLAVALWFVAYASKQEVINNQNSALAVAYANPCCLCQGNDCGAPLLSCTTAQRALGQKGKRAKGQKGKRWVSQAKPSLDKPSLA